VPLVRDAQRDEIRMTNAKLFRDAVDLAFFGYRDRLVSYVRGQADIEQ
jgi:hypothetical protein